MGPTVATKVIYMFNLQRSRRLYDGPRCSVVADCDLATGRLLGNNRLILKQHFKSPAGGNQGEIYTCTCDHGVAQHERLTAISSTLEEDFVDFYNTEIKEQCMHASVLELLASAPTDVYDENSPRQREQDIVVDCLNGVPLTWLLLSCCPGY